MVTDKKCNHFLYINFPSFKFSNYHVLWIYEGENVNLRLMMGIQGWVSEAAARDGGEEEWIHEVNSPREKNRWARVCSSSLLYYNTALIHRSNTETACFVDAMGLLLFLNVLRIRILINFHIPVVSLYSIQFLLAISKSITGGWHWALYFWQDIPFILLVISYMTCIWPCS